MNILLTIGLIILGILALWALAVGAFWLCFCFGALGILGFAGFVALWWFYPVIMAGACIILGAVVIVCELLEPFIYERRLLKNATKGLKHGL